jgi:hypothetical protein
MWTLEHDGVEKSLVDWGLSERVTRTRMNQAPDVVTIYAPGAMDAASAFAYGAAVVVRRDRTFAAGAYSGGTIFFRGKAGLAQRSGSGASEGINYRFYGPWWDLQRLVFQQEWNEFAGWTIPGDASSDPTFTVKRTSELYLGQSITGAKLNTGGQISEAISWAITCGVSCALGTIDAAANIPIYNVRDITVAEVIVQMLRWTPDVVCWFDYTTTPPTFHARKRANLVDVAVTVDGLSELSIIPRYDLQLPAVCLRFLRTDTVDGRPSKVIVDQNAPPGATGQELGASVHTIELQGSAATNVYGELECAACNAQHGTEATRIAWWQAFEPLLASGYINPSSLHVTVASVKDKNGDAVSLAGFPNVLVSGQVAPWMTIGGGTPVSEVSVTVKAVATYDLYRKPNGWSETNASQFLAQRKRTKELSVNLRLTNGVSGTYSALGSFSGGEDVPTGLAAEIYNAHATLQHEGTIVLVADEVPSGIGPGNTLTISTGSATYADCLVQSVVEDIGSGRISITIGPAKQLGVADLVELLRVNRYRIVYNNPAVRITGSASGGGNVQLGKAVPKENTTAGLGDQELFAISAAAAESKTNVNALDAANKRLLMEVQNAAGERDTSHGSVELKLDDTIGTDGNKHEVKLRQVLVCVQGNSMAAIASISEAFDPTAP